MLHFEVLDEGIRIDKYLKDKLNLPRNQIKKLIDEGHVYVNLKKVKSSYLVKKDDYIEVSNEPSQDEVIIKENIPLDIIYEDEYLLVINKPSGMIVHPGNGHKNHTLVNALLNRYHDHLSKVNGQLRPGIVHRIDADTSGLLVVAKDDITHIDLAKQIKEKSALRKYIALVGGTILESRLTIDAPIGRNPHNRKAMCVTDISSKDAITHVKVLERYPQATLVECMLETGRTHQIRVHMAYINHPVINDPVYGHYKSDESFIKSHLQDQEQIKKYRAFGQLLHAYEIGFIHPSTKQKMVFQKDIPDTFKEILKMYQE